LLFNYFPSENLDNNCINNRIYKKFGILDSNSIASLYFANNSTAILAIFMFLKLKNIRKLYIVSIAYFLIEELCNMFNIEFEYISIDVKNNKYVIDTDKLNAINTSYIWITNPILFSNETYDIESI